MPSKRLNPCDTSQDSPPAKRIRLTAAARIASNFPPEFWDRLPKVYLTPRALREKDRRKGAQLLVTTSSTPISVTSTTLAQFARRGGPDLSHLRGYPEPKHAAPMSSNRPSNPLIRRIQSADATGDSGKVRRSSAYDDNFELDLACNDIYPEWFPRADGRSTPKPNNLDDITKSLAHRRASLSLSQFSDLAFERFRMASNSVVSECNVIGDILPTIRGNSDILSQGNLPFTNLTSITNNVTVKTVPDRYDGSHACEVNKTVRQNLDKMIIPTGHARAPIVPNFFIEVKSTQGSSLVARRQACLDGAIGARAMHSLQTYGEEELSYDGNAYAFSSTYFDGILKIYAHYVTGPMHDGKGPEYHMTQLRAYALTSDRETFVQGVTAFRNLRDFARLERERFIRTANAREETSGDASGDNTIEATVWQDSHDDLQQQIANSCAGESEENGEATTTPLQHCSSDEAKALVKF